MKKNLKTCKFCHHLKYLPGGGSYCISCYRKFIKGKKECKRCHRLRVIIGRGYCGACYNYLMGYYGGTGSKLNSQLKQEIQPQKCFFCNENRIEMLDVHYKRSKRGKNAGNLILLCPTHHREVHLKLRGLPCE